MRVPTGRALVATLLLVAARAVCAAPPADPFDELYARGQQANAGIKTLTARFVETTTSSLLTKPMVARGRLAVERPSRVVMRYSDPDVRTVLIDGNAMTIAWPSRNVRQHTDIGTAQGRVQKYFVKGTAADLRREFDVTDHGVAADHGDTEFVTLVPKRKQIREALAQLDLWVDRATSLPNTMKLTFANGDTKTLTFEDVVANAALAPGTFALDK